MGNRRGPEGAQKPCGGLAPTHTQTQTHTAPLKILFTVSGLSPSREPFPPSRLKPSPAEVFSSVTVCTVASAAG